MKLLYGLVRLFLVKKSYQNLQRMGQNSYDRLLMAWTFFNVFDQKVRLVFTRVMVALLSSPHRNGEKSLLLSPKETFGKVKTKKRDKLHLDMGKRGDLTLKY